MKRESEEWIAIARVGKPQGLTGGVRVHPYSPDSQTLMSIQEVEIDMPNGKRKRFHIDHANSRKGYTFLQLEGISSRDEASKWTNHVLFARRSDFPQILPGEFYCSDLIGLSVEDESGRALGEVKEIISTGANDVYVVKGREEILLPAISNVVLRIDLEKSRIVVRPLEVMDAV